MSLELNDQFYHSSSTKRSLCSDEAAECVDRRVRCALLGSFSQIGLLRCDGLGTGPLQQFEAVLAALLGAWEEVKAAEEARVQLEGQLFKTKAQSTTILTEEARFQCPYSLSLR